MRLNRSTLEMARLCRLFSLPFFSVGGLLALARFGVLRHSHSAARVAFDLGLVAWALALGSLVLCAMMIALVPQADDPPTIDPVDGPLFRR